MDGLAWQTDAFRLVLVDSTDRWTRQRFTLAHELGHILAHDAQNRVIEDEVAPGLQPDPSEVRANAFAACLLMPEDEIRRAFPAYLDETSFARLVARFRVSPSALATRLHSLGLIDSAYRDRLRPLTTSVCHESFNAMEASLAQATAATAERPPVRMVSELFAAHQAGETTLRPLAALLGTDADDLHDLLVREPPMPRPDEPTTAEDPVFLP